MGIFTSKVEQCPKCNKSVVVDGGFIEDHDCKPKWGKEEYTTQFPEGDIMDYVFKLPVHDGGRKNQDK